MSSRENTELVAIAIYAQKWSIMLLSSAPKITYYAFKKMPIILKIMPLV